MSYTINTGSLFGQPLLTYSGLASGLNTSAIVDAQTAAASQNQTLLNSDATIEASKAALYANIANQLGQLDSAVLGLHSAGLFAPSMVTSSNPSVISVTGTTTAQTGNYQVNVTQLAQGQINNSSNFSSANSTVLSTAGIFPPTSGSVQIAVGSGAATTFNLTSSTTLTGLANSINASGLAVKASVVNDANGYHINLASTSTGTSSALTISETNSNLNFNGNLVQSAQDAMGSVNGTSFDIQTNTSSTLITGVTMSFSSLTSSPVAVNVYKDATSLGSTVQAFVLNYNEAVTAINGATTYGTQTNLGNLLSDGSVQNVTGDLNTVVTSAPASASGIYHTLAEIGITQNNDGTLAVDNNALSAAIANDASSVANLLSDTSSGAGIASQLNAITTTYGGPAGTFMQMSTAQAAIGAQDAQTASNMQYSIDAQAATMRTNFVNYEVTMSALAAQNMVVESFANSINSNTAANNTPVAAAADTGSANGQVVTPMLDSLPPSDAITSSTATGSNGVVPVLSNSTV